MAGADLMLRRSVQAGIPQGICSVRSRRESEVVVEYEFSSTVTNTHELIAASCLVLQGALTNVSRLLHSADFTAR